MQGLDPDAIRNMAQLNVGKPSTYDGPKLTQRMSADEMDAAFKAAMAQHEKNGGFGGDQPVKLTKEEQDRLSEAIKKPEFQELMNDYMQEISDPKNREEYDQYLKQCEDEVKKKYYLYYPFFRSNPGPPRVRAILAPHPLTSHTDCTVRVRVMYHYHSNRAKFRRT